MKLMQTIREHTPSENDFYLLFNCTFFQLYIDTRALVRYRDPPGKGTLRKGYQMGWYSLGARLEK